MSERAESSHGVKQYEVLMKLYGPRNPRRFLLFVAVVASLVTASIPALATTVVKLDPKTHLAKSDIVVRAEVTDRTSFRGDDGHIYTESTIQVSEALYGEARPGDELIVRQWGGQVDGIIEAIPGDAKLSVGDDVVLFLADREPEGRAVFLTALAQSMYRVIGQTDGGDLQLYRDLSGLTFYNPKRAEPLFTVRQPDLATMGTLRQTIERVDRQEVNQ